MQLSSKQMVYYFFLTVCISWFSQGTNNFIAEAAPAISKKEVSKEEDVVFVAGATGKVGSRTVR